MRIWIFILLEWYIIFIDLYILKKDIMLTNMLEIAVNE